MSGENLSSTSGAPELVPVVGADGVPLSAVGNPAALEAFQRGIDRANEIFADPGSQQLPPPNTVAVVRPAKRQVPQSFIDQKTALTEKADMRPKPLSQRQTIDQMKARREAAKYGDGTQ